MPDSQAGVFERSGIAALSDLQSQEWKAIYSLLEKEQSEFLMKEDHFRSSEYKWPHDPLHTWSRVWEYPYTYYHLKNWCVGKNSETALHVVDLGSGVTFFPFSVARLGYCVTCVDIDPVVSIDLPRAAGVIDHNPGRVLCRLYDDSDLPFVDEEVDAVYCVSVLEHVPSFEHLIAEVARILKPGGLFVLTIDLDMRGDQAIDSEGYSCLTRCFQESFEHYRPVRTVHPLNVLSSDTGPFPIHQSNLCCFLMKEAIRRLIGRPPMDRLPFKLTAEGMVLTRLRQVC